HGKYKKKYSQQIIETVLTELLNTTIAELENGNAVIIREYFSIKPVWRDTKNARNVVTGEKVVIPARYQLKVKVARFLKEACERFNNKILSEEK
ncbi:HU family DNA-binding protein, partial [uncultured Brachyspira sp.]|uniref:HU family DNA-binding protein n=1 Tax=uncultured Brachyspira sp. TaxID=221953 RepID=UPI0032209CCA